MILTTIPTIAIPRSAATAFFVLLSVTVSYLTSFDDYINFAPFLAALVASFASLLAWLVYFALG
jgi:hypothetical protein